MFPRRDPVKMLGVNLHHDAGALGAIIDQVLAANPKQAEQSVRGAISLPHGTGKTVRLVPGAKGGLKCDGTDALDAAGKPDGRRALSDGDRKAVIDGQVKDKKALELLKEKQMAALRRERAEKERAFLEELSIQRALR